MLQVMEKNGWAAPVTIFATHLNAPCSSILLAQSQIPSKVYLIIGKVNGETVFFPLDRSECVSKFESEHCEPITALASGDLQNNSTKEVVTVSSNGLLQSLRFPKSENMSDAEPPIPSRVFFQQLNSNIICCEIMDVDNDGQNEFFVVMTDKTLRSYRFSTENRCLIAQNKWEMPSQISGCSISTGSSGNYFAYLSQACKSDFIRLDFGPLKNVSIMHSKGVDRKHSTLLFIPPNPKTIRLMQSLISKIIVVDGEGSEIELHNKAGDFVCVAHTQLPSGISIVMSICPFGNLFVYAFTSDDVLSEPVARCQVLRDVDHCASFPGPSSYSLFLSLVNIYNKVAIYLIDFSHIIQIRQIM
ncbi:Integrin-alpha FG-GAP repeat-containing protein 2 [Aphelenchoides bicaudatus]|nr:Integrin-alpha FG-GAP repeat-containing protein 2 [Aphelenchoides bicaudatus]